MARMLPLGRQHRRVMLVLAVLCCGVRACWGGVAAMLQRVQRVCLVWRRLAAGGTMGRRPAVLELSWSSCVPRPTHPNTHPQPATRAPQGGGPSVPHLSLSEMYRPRVARGSVWYSWHAWPTVGV